MRKPLKELGAEYLDSAAKLSTRITELKAKLKTTRGAERADVNNRINLLYKDARSAKLTGLYLMNYYNRSANYVRKK